MAEEKKKKKKGEIKDIGKKGFDYGTYVKTNVKKGLKFLGLRKGGKVKKYGGGGDPGQGGGSQHAMVSRYSEDYDKKRKRLETDDMARKGRKIKKKVKKKRYGGSVSYSSSSVKGYSKTYSGMGGEDE